MVFRISAIMLSLVIVTGSQQLRSQSKANPGGFDLVDRDREHSASRSITAIITLHLEHS